MHLLKSTGEKEKNYKLLMFMEEQCFNSTTIHSTYDTNYSISNNQKFCGKTFDGLLCWDPTPAGHVAYQPCSSLIVGWDTTHMTYKRCLDDGTWLRDLITNKYWSDYTQCVDYEDLMFRLSVNDIYVWGYTLSIILLIISLSVFFYYKRILLNLRGMRYRHLQCSRTIVHVNLFVSLLINDSLWVVWYKYVVADAEILQEDGYLCHTLHILIQYFMVTSYFWAFCEGLHLHLSISVVFMSNEKLMKWFYFIGWGLPLIITVIYAVLRYYSGSTSQCWIGENDASWVIFYPVFISLLASTVFLINAVRVLVVKLRSGTRMMATKKAARAACILIPLFGLHYLLIPFRPSQKSPGEHAYEIISAVVTSCQGVCVAVLFCFTNTEVVITICNHFKRWRQKKDAIAMTGTTGDRTEDVNAEEIL